MNPLTAEFLRGYVPFHVFNNTRLQVLAKQCQRVYLRKGQVLMEPGRSQNQAFFLMSGRMQFSKTGEEVSPRFYFPLHYKYQRQDVLAAITDCSLFQIEKVILDKFVSWSQAICYLEHDISCQRQFDGDAEWMRIILQSNLFYKVPPLNINRVFSHLIAQPVKKNQVILTQGEVGDGCFFIKEGAAVVTRKMEKDEKPVILAEIGVGRCFGEDALVHETVRNATVTMMTDGLLMKMEKRDFVQLLREPAVEMLSFSDLDLAMKTGARLLDVRTVKEFEYEHINEAVSMPLANLRLTAKMLDTYASCVIYCDTDRRSRAAAYLLEQLGFRARALAGGLNTIPFEKKQVLVGNRAAL